MTDKEFFKDLDECAKPSLDFLKKNSDILKTVARLNLWVDVPCSVLKKYELNEDIVVQIEIIPEEIKLLYYYKGVEIKPECCCIKPDPYTAVSTLKILQEAIRQDRYDPDIKPLERGEVNS